MNRRMLLSGLAAAPFAGVAASQTDASALLMSIDADVVSRKAFAKEMAKPNIWNVANEIMEALLPIHPEGFGCNKKYQVSVDEATGNIIVHHELLGFAITKKTIEDGIYLEQARATFPCLVTAIDQYRQIPEESRWRYT